MINSSQKIEWAEDNNYRKSFGRFATGVTVITTVTPEGKQIGLTANSFTSVSMDPPIVLWSLSCHSRYRMDYVNCEFFAIHILSSAQQFLAQRFCSKMEDRFEGLELIRGSGGIPLLPGCSAVIECRRGEVVTWGDHDVISGQVERHAYAWPERQEQYDPLAFLGGEYGNFTSQALLQRQQA